MIYIVLLLGIPAILLFIWMSIKYPPAKPSEEMEEYRREIREKKEKQQKEYRKREGIVRKMEENRSIYELGRLPQKRYPFLIQ